MLESITREVIVGTGLIGTSLMVVIASLCLMRPRHEKRRDIDLEAAVRDAPYHLLRESADGPSR